MSTTATTYTAISAFVAAENAFLGKNRDWWGENPQQTQFIENYLNPRRFEVGKITEIETVAALSEAPINKFLADRKFQISLKEFPKLTPPEYAWGAAAVLDLLVEWKTAGKKSTIVSRSETFSAALIEDSLEVVKVAGHDYPVGRILTKSGDVAHFSLLDTQLEGFALIEKAKELSGGGERMWGYTKMKFPMIDLDHTVDISWMVGMKTSTHDNLLAILTQAVQQTKLKMNHVGARVKDAVAIGGIAVTSIQADLMLILDRPFLFCVTRPGLSDPLFSAYLTEANWKDPGSLGNM